jgi:hypothetical protein
MKHVQTWVPFLHHSQQDLHGIMYHVCFLIYPKQLALTQGTFDYVS